MSPEGFAKFFGGNCTDGLPFVGFPFDAQSLLETQRKNLQAFLEAWQVSLASLQAMGQHQSEIISRLIEDQSSFVRDILSEGTPEQRVARQTDLIRENYERSMANWRELSDIANKSGKEAGDIIGKRMTASLNELKSSLTKKSGTSAAGSNSHARKKAA